MRSVRITWAPSILTVLIVFMASVQTGLPQETATPEAASQGQGVVFGVYPQGGAEGQFFEAEVAPGSSHEFNLALLNAGEDALRLLAYPADVYSMTNGGLGVSFQDVERTAPTTWLKFPEGFVDVASGEELIVPFTVTVPDGIAPGQYVTAIGVETAAAYSLGEASPFSQVIRKVIAVAIVVPGPVEPSFVLGAPKLTVIEGQSVLRIPVENTGNIRVRPTGTVTLRDSSGGELATGEVAMGSVYMGDTAPYELWLAVELPEGNYVVSANLVDPDTGASAVLENVPTKAVTPVEATAEPDDSGTPIPATPEPVLQSLTLDSATITANAEPIQFANVALGIENSGDHVARSRVTLTVSKDGTVVEDVVVDDNLPLPVGPTIIEYRYVPPTGWESGSWSFTLAVHAMSPNADVETLLLSEQDIAAIDVP